MCLVGVVFGLQVVAVGYHSMMCCFLMVAGFVVFSRLMVVLCCFFMVLGSMCVVL